MVHPYVLKHMLIAVDHVKRFRDHIGSLSAKGENAQIAKDVLMDAIDYSGIHLDVLIGTLHENLLLAAKIPGTLKQFIGVVDTFDHAMQGIT